MKKGERLYYYKFTMGGTSILYIVELIGEDEDNEKNLLVKFNEKIYDNRGKIEDFTGHNFSVPKAQLATPETFYEGRSRQLIHWVFTVTGRE